MTREKQLNMAVTIAEDLLGNNIVWLADKLDPYIRAGDKETISRLKKINEAWETLAKAKQQIPP